MVAGICWVGRCISSDHPVARTISKSNAILILLGSELHKEIQDTVAYSENFPFYTSPLWPIDQSPCPIPEKIEIPKFLSGLCRPTHDDTIILEEKNPPAYVCLVKPEWHLYFFQILLTSKAWATTQLQITKSAIVTMQLFHFSNCKLVFKPWSYLLYSKVHLLSSLLQ